MKKFVFLSFLLFLSSFVVACAGGLPQDKVSGNEAEPPGRFVRAEKYGQFIDVNKSVDCNGTLVTIEKILLDKTGTFMIASVEGDIRGKIDPLNVKLFDGQDRNLGWNSFLQEYPAKLPGDKTLLTA